MKDERAADIVKRLLQAAEIFAERNPYADQTRQSWSVWWHVVPEADDLFRKAVNDLVRSNPTQLSYLYTASTLTYHGYPSLSFLALGESQVDKTALETALRRTVLDLANARESRRLQFIVENLVIDGAVPRFFGVELVAPTSDELQALYDDPLIRSPHTSAVGLANVNAPGDPSAAYDWGVRQVERFLNLVQGCGSDRVLGNFYPVHIIDRNPVVERTPVREWRDGQFRTTLRQQFGTRELRYARIPGDLLSFLSPIHIERLVPATTGTTTKLLTAVTASFETLGEACKPNLAPTRMLLASSALEMLAGARASADVTFQGQTAAIVERATFLVGGKNVSERQAFDRRLRDLYRKGSGVRHGARPDISTDEIVELMSTTRKVALALLERSDLQDHQALDTWVQEMRYTTEVTPTAAQ